MVRIGQRPLLIVNEKIEVLNCTAFFRTPQSLTFPYPARATDQKKPCLVKKTCFLYRLHEKKKKFDARKRRDGGKEKKKKKKAYFG